MTLKMYKLEIFQVSYWEIVLMIDLFELSSLPQNVRIRGTLEMILSVIHTDEEIGMTVIESVIEIIPVIELG